MRLPYCGKETRKMTTYFRWTPERMEEVQRLSAEGLSNPRIAERLGVDRQALQMALSRHNMVKNGLTHLSEGTA